MSSNLNILKWLFALVLIFGGFTVYKIFGVLAADLEGKEYVWLVKIISEFGLFTSVVISVGFFHHWIIATEERKETEKMFHNVLTKYIDGTVINAKTRGFLGITNKELDFSEIMHGLYSGDYVYWLITFDPRYKHHCREFEHAIKKGVHFRMLILKDCPISELCAREIIGYSEEEFRGYDRLFLASLEDIAGRINERDEGSLGVFVYDSLPNIPLLSFFAIKQKSWKFLTVFTCPSRLEECPIYTGSPNLNAIPATPLSRKNGICRTFSWTTFRDVGLRKEINWTKPTKRI